MNFIFDRQGKVLYKLAAKPSRVQGVVDELTIFFSQLRLEGRDRYRLILVGDRNQPYPRGTAISAEIRLNEGSGFRREAIILQAEAKLDDQYNFELDFEAQDVPTITDVRVTVQAYHAVHTALLFARHRFFAGHTQDPANGARGVEPAPGRSEEVASSTRFSPQENGRTEAPPFGGGYVPPVSPREGAPRTQPPVSRPLDTANGLPAWSPRNREEEATGENDPATTRPRRRRLE
jgi:hypothetical protein